jgi:hypothetical protein
LLPPEQFGESLSPVVREASFISRLKKRAYSEELELELLKPMIASTSRQTVLLTAYQL